MQTEFLKSFANVSFGTIQQPVFEDGTFSLVNRTIVTAETMNTKFNAGLETATDFLSIGFKPELTISDVVTDYSGYNRKFIDDRGMYDMHSAVDEFSRRVPGVKLTKQDIDAMARASQSNDSHTMFIYNMLVSWFKAVLYRDTRSENGILKVKFSAYKDSHVGIGIRGQYSDAEHLIEMGPPVSEMLDAPEPVMRTQSNYWNHPFVIKYRANDKFAATFYYCHVLGRDGNSMLNVDVALPGIDMRETLFEPIGTNNYIMADPDDVPWTKPELIWLWIKDYVELNRVHTAFASAFEALGAVAFQPKPSYQESAHWHQAKIRLVLSPFTPTRARIPANLDGEAYLKSTDAHEFNLAETSAPKSYLGSASVLNYMLWLGLYGLAYNYATQVSSWQTAFSAKNGEMAILDTIHTRAAVISCLVNKEMVTCFDENCHVTYDLTPMAYNHEIRCDEIVEQGYSSLIKIDGIYPYVSGALIIGGINADIDCLKHLHGNAQIQADQYSTFSRTEALIITSIYRIFGHSVKPVHEKSGETYDVYAATRECVICPTPILNNTREFDRLMLTDSVMREGRHYLLPNAGSLRHANTFQYTINTPDIVMTRFGSRTQRVRAALLLPTRKGEIHFKVRATTVMKDIVIRPSRTDERVQPGFHRGPNELAPIRPIAPVRVDTQPMEREDNMEPAESAE